jgi:hypothetical protein
MTQPAADTEESLAAWRVRLERADEELADRERAVLDQDEPDRAALDALASTRDEVGAEWDELAARYDAWARQRDLAALQRDGAASGRDIKVRALADDRDAGFANRWLSANDRDDSGGDRADSFDDRRRGAEARQRAAAERDKASEDRDAATVQSDAQEQELEHLRRALNTRTAIGQAIGLLMGRYGLSSDAAFAMICRWSQETNVKVRDLATSILAEAQPGPTGADPTAPA